MVRVKGGDDSLREEVAGRGGRRGRERPYQVTQPQGIEDVLRQFLKVPVWPVVDVGEVSGNVTSPRSGWEGEESHGQCQAVLHAIHTCHHRERQDNSLVGNF